MSSIREQASPTYAISIVALVFGAVLAIGVSAVFGLLGWGGELASQTAGAASGAAPLIIDGVRQRRSRVAGRASPRAVTAGLLRRYNKLWLASAFGFAVVLLNAAVGLIVGRMTRWSIQLAEGDPDRFWPVYNLIGSIVIWPTVLTGTFLLAKAAGHRLGRRNRRWIVLGIGIYTVVTTGMLIAGGPSSNLSLTTGVLVASVLLSAALLAWVALLGARRARRTQAAYFARVYFRRLGPADQEAALALLDEAVTQTPPPATPPAAAPSSAAGPPVPPRAGPR